MPSRFLFLFLVLTGAGSFVPFAAAQDDPGHQVPDVGLGYYLESAIAFDHPGATLMVLPDGGGYAFTSASYCDGFVAQPVDATISVRILDEMYDPLVAYPREDIWLEPAGGGELALCPGGTLADLPTDQDGETFWQTPLRAGGWSQEGIVVRIAEFHYPDGPLPLQINSPDLNGDLQVNLTDVTIFAGDYFGDYHFRSDFVFDHVVNLLDVTRMAAAWGARCP